MPHRAWLAVLLLAASALAGCAGPSEPSGPVTVSDDFEKGIRNWQKGADVPQDPNAEGNTTVSWAIEPTSGRAVSGEFSVNFSIDGSQDDGTIWLVRPLKVQAGQAYQANVSALAYSASESFNTLAHFVMYLGTERPIVEEDFPAPGENTTDTPNASRGGLRETLNQQEGWRSYGFGWNVPEDNNGTLWAAFGISAVWETQMDYQVDDLRIELEPLQPAAAGEDSGPY